MGYYSRFPQECQGKTAFSVEILFPHLLRQFFVILLKNSGKKNRTFFVKVLAI